MTLIFSIIGLGLSIFSIYLHKLNHEFLIEFLKEYHPELVKEEIIKDLRKL